MSMQGKECTTSVLTPLERFYVGPTLLFSTQVRQNRPYCPVIHGENRIRPWWNSIGGMWCSTNHFVLHHNIICSRIISVSWTLCIPAHDICQWDFSFSQMIAKIIFDCFESLWPVLLFDYWWSGWCLIMRLRRFEFSKCTHCSWSNCWNITGRPIRVWCRT